MRILITGGFGFIGGRLATDLFRAGHEVVIGTRHPVSSPDWLPQSDVVKMVWDDEVSLSRSCDGIDAIIHAAGMNVQDCDADPVSALGFNGLATAKLVAAAGRENVKRFIYLSTAHVYSGKLTGVITEETCPRNTHPYATSHLAGENIVLNANQQGQIDGIVLRLSNVFGAPMQNEVNCWTLLANDLCRQISNTRKLVLRSNGNQRRDFISMSEICRILQHITTYGADTLSTKVINVGSGTSQTVYEISKLIQSRCKILLGFEPEILRPIIGFPEKAETFVYKTNRLAELGLNVSIDNTFEIDNLITFCQSSFKKSYRDNV